MTEKEFGDYLRNFFNKAFGLNLKPEEETDSYDDSGDDSTAFVFTKGAVTAAVAGVCPG